MKKIKFLYQLLLLLFISNSAKALDQEAFEIKYFKYPQGRIAFSYLSDKSKDIYYLDFGTLAVKPLITSPGADESPSWSPNGQKIIFQSDLSGDKEIYIANYDGTGLIQLTKSPGADENPSFSNDGKKIVFQSSRRDPSSAELYLMNADGSEQTPIFSEPPLPKTKLVTPKFSPRGDEILYVTNLSWPGWDLNLYNINTKEKLALTEGLGSFIRPSWKADGSAYTFSYRAVNITDIWLARKGNATPQNIIHRDGQSLDPCWHDTDENIFFVSEATAGKEDYKLFIYENLDTSDNSPKSKSISRVLISKGNIRTPSWTPFSSQGTLINKLKEEKKN